MGYDPSKELVKVKKKIEAKKRELSKAFEKGNDSKAKEIGREIDRLQTQKRKYEDDFLRFQGPA